MSVVTPTILSSGQAMDPAFELLSIDVTKELNRIPYARLVLLDGDAAQQTFAISNRINSLNYGNDPQQNEGGQPRDRDQAPV